MHTNVMKKPDVVNILGIRYTIEYVDNPAEVDKDKRKSLWGQIDYWERKIRIYDNGRPDEDVFQTLMHEIIHAIDEALHLELCEENKGHDKIDLIALALTDVVFRNEWLTLLGGEENALDTR